MAAAPPSLALPIRRRFHWTALFEWWHLLSLDAPTVAVLWAWSLARAVDVRLPRSALLLLGLGTWLIYVSDRILDGLHLNGLHPDRLRYEGHGRLRERHLFYARRRKFFVIASLPAALVLLWIVFSRMVTAAREADTALFALAMLYFCLIHLRGPAVERWLPKELVVGAIFAAATAVPAWARLGGDGDGLLPATALFALLCWLNCAAIEKWERKKSERERVVSSPAHVTTRWAQSHLRGISMAVALMAALACALSFYRGWGSGISLLDLACVLSAGLFPLLDCTRLSAFHLRIAADLALLTPLLCVVALR